MAYRNGTYVAFAADGGKDIINSDIKFYYLLKKWDLMKDREFRLINSHEKGPSLRSGSLDETIKRTLRGRLDNSSRFLLLVGNTTKLDDDFVPYEIKYAIDNCEIPVIICFVNYKKRITNVLPTELSNLLPQVLVDRIKNGSVKTILLPFKQRILNFALNDFKYNKHPSFGMSGYKDWVYDKVYGSDKDSI